MQLVKENINFKRGSNPQDSLDIGKNSNTVKTNVYNSLIEKGIKFWKYYTDYSMDEREQYFIDNIYEIKIMVDRLVEVGVDINSITVNNKDRCGCDQWKVLSHNRVIAECIVKEDAEKIIEIMKAFNIESHSVWTVELDTNITFYSTENSIKILDNLIKNRKIYNT